MKDDDTSQEFHFLHDNWLGPSTPTQPTTKDMAAIMPDTTPLQGIEFYVDTSSKAPIVSNVQWSVPNDTNGKKSAKQISKSHEKPLAHVNSGFQTVHVPKYQISTDPHLTC